MVSVGGKEPVVSPVGTLFDKLGGELLEATAERVVGRIPVEGNTQPLGYLHGGATAALAETVASVGAWMASGGCALPSRLARSASTWAKPSRWGPPPVATSRR